LAVMVFQFAGRIERRLIRRSGSDNGGGWDFTNASDAPRLTAWRLSRIDEE